MIRESTPLTMAEVSKLAGSTEKEINVKKFVAQFISISYEKAIEMKEELKNLDLIKLKEEHIVKIVDFKPADAVELNKIVLDASLDQDEINKILEITKKY